MKKFVSLLLSFLLLCSLLTACGGSSTSTSNGYALKQESEMEAPAAMAMDGEVLTEERGAGAPDALPEARKWIVTVHINAETDDLDTMTAALEEKIAAMKGYVEDQSVYNGSAYEGRRYRSAHMTVRVPAENVDQFTEDVSGISNVVNKSKTLEDVTLTYVATESRVKALQTEETRLLELLAEADNMTDLLEIEGRLADVRYELENYGTQLKILSNQIDYATIYLNIDEVQEYTPVEEPSLWERIAGGFADSLDGLWESLQSLLVFVIAALPYVAVYGGILALIAIPLRKLRAKRKARKAEKKAAKEAKKPEEEA